MARLTGSGLAQRTEDQMSQYVPTCPTCRGSGSVDVECNPCGGTGRRADGTTCSWCRGLGKKATRCTRCGGSGRAS